MTDPLSDVSLSELRSRQSVKWRMYEPDVLPLFVAEMDSALAPPVAAALTAAVERGDTGYPHPGRFPAAFTAFAERRYGWVVPSEPVLVADVMVGLMAALDEVCGPGDAVVVSTPAYPPFFRNLELSGRRLVSSPLKVSAEGFALDLDRLEADFASGAKAYLLCNPHNPCGLAYSRAELLAVAGLAERYGVRVVADEIHAPLTMPGVGHVPFASLDTEASALAYTAVSASKAWNLAGLKAALLVSGAACARPASARDLEEHVGHLGVLGGTAAFEEGEEWLDGLRAAIAVNAAWLGAELARRLPEVAYFPPRATYLAWLDFRALGLGDDPAEVLREKGRVALVPGLDFGAEGAGFARLNLATSPAILAEGVDRIVKAVR
ncbi:cystathionine beta-lyase [Phytomonospora endophytica]|uniref:cysteine-S-conjugate beta-lyase n=2 Tax=Phytomonospora endophytica TaxID=714109 RepID=A0A841FDI5_9ACTN|nr:cystathionine beta-lyase [Phytomonospora endophytica]